MKSYRVVWETQVEADTPEQAAKEALLLQRDPGFGSTIFRVRDEKTGEETQVELGAR